MSSGNFLNTNADWAHLASQARYHATVLARLAHCSLRQLERHFAKHFRQSPQDWLDNLRLALAPRLLVTRQGVKWVSAQLGFADRGNFSRRFKAMHGLGPLDFIRVHDHRQAARRARLQACFPGGNVPEDWLLDPTVANPWAIVLQNHPARFRMKDSQSEDENVALSPQMSPPAPSPGVRFRPKQGELIAGRLKRPKPKSLTP